MGSYYVVADADRIYARTADRAEASKIALRVFRAMGEPVTIVRFSGSGAHGFPVAVVTALA